jgi:Domain of unknown function (DUF4338)/DDE_Tnp_1-associated
MNHSIFATSTLLAQELVSREFTIGVAQSDAAKDWCRARLNDEHSLGAGAPCGHQLWQVVRRVVDGVPVAIVVWAASALHLKDRDAWIGWDPMRRASRLGLIVNNSRLLILEATRERNLASASLGAALRVLPAQWEAVHGFKPVLAEAFVDIESHAGTTYKVTNWVPLGLTKGSSRARADFYIANERPKKLWVKPLRPDAQAVLCAAELPPELKIAEIAPAYATMPLSHTQIVSLRGVLRLMPDPRRESHTYKISSMLTIVCLGLLCGARNFSDIMRHAGKLSQGLRRDIGLPLKKGTKFYKVPTYNGLRDLLKRLDMGHLERLLTKWQGQHEGSLPRSLAMDGKDLGKELGILVSLVLTGDEQEAGTPVAMKTADKGHELKSAQDILRDEDVRLEGSIVTADSLHCQQETARIIVGRGGDYIISLKDNQPTINQEARRLLEAAAPLLPKSPKKGTDV